MFLLVVGSVGAIRLKSSALSSIILLVLDEDAKSSEIKLHAILLFFNCQFFGFGIVGNFPHLVERKS